MGEKAPSLPELELLAFYLDVPLRHFWGNTALSESEKREDRLQPQKLMEIRQKIIGALLRQAREGAGLSLQEASERVAIPKEQLEAFEVGQTSIPLPILEHLGNTFNRPIHEFQDKQGPVGRRESQRATLDSLLELSPELRAFVSKPINTPFLELAQRMSEMPVDKLRSIGEGILEITL
jgi:transcriptional regulator with XRE-family HTH domain